jgi:outer membrane immunogenic protein
VQKHLLGRAAIIVLIGAGSANAGDSVTAPLLTVSSPQHNWNGFYGGLTAGAAWGQYDFKTSTIGGSYIGQRAAAAVNAAGAQTVNPTGFATGIEGGYNWQIGNLLFGTEADLQGVNLQGATNNGAVHYPGWRANSP